MSESAKPTIFIDNARTCVTEWRFEAGAATGWHQHAYDYVIIPMLDGKLKIIDSEGESVVELQKGIPYFRNLGVEHDVINANDFEYAFIEVEIKS